MTSDPIEGRSDSIRDRRHFLKVAALAAATPVVLRLGLSGSKEEPSEPLVKSHVARSPTFDRRNQNCCWVAL